MHQGRPPVISQVLVVCSSKWSATHTQWSLKIHPMVQGRMHLLIKIWDMWTTSWDTRGIFVWLNLSEVNEDPFVCKYTAGWALWKKGLFKKYPIALAKWKGTDVTHTNESSILFIQVAPFLIQFNKWMDQTTKIKFNYNGQSSSIKLLTRICFFICKERSRQGNIAVHY